MRYHGPHACVLAACSLGLALAAATSTGGACRGAGAANAGQLQPRHPADPLEQLFRLPRPRRHEARDGVPLRHAAKARSPRTASSFPGDAAGSMLVKRISNPDPEKRMPPPDSGHALTAHANRVAAPLDRRRREVGHALGLHAAVAARAAAPVDEGRVGRAIRSTASSSRASSARS